MTYTVEIKPAAKRQIRKLSPPIQAAIVRQLEELAEEPRPVGVKKLSGEENTYRVRVGDYRILYEICDRILLVWVVRVENRRDVYRKR